MQTATADPLVGRVLEGRYRIVDRIARGGMSTVYEAVDQRLDRRVAVKVMSPTLSSDTKFGDRFAREARAAARLTHVNAVAVYDQGHDRSGGEHHVFLVMELVPGRTLRDLIRERGGRFTPAEAVSIMEPVLSALSAAHRAGLVHRDVKPENILLSDDGLVKVADFGLARAVDTDAASTRTGLMMGTVAYCPPEQIVHGRCDTRSDVYSAGIVLFELLTGQPPYSGESAMNVAYQHVHSRVPAPSSRVKGIPTAIDEIVVSATDSDPAGRPADASTFLAELADARANLALPIVPVPPRARSANAARETTARVGRSSSTTDVIATPFGSAGHRSSRPTGRVLADDYTAYVPTSGRRVPDDQPPPPVVIPPPKRSARARRRRRRLIMLVAVLLLGALSVGGGITGVRLFREWNTYVPKVAGFPLDEAKAALKRTGYAISPKTSTQFNNTVPKGSVISTVPAAGTRRGQGQPVELVISLGKDRVAVPDVANQGTVQAESTLQARGLQVAPRTTLEYSTTVANGNVISTLPKTGTLVTRDSPVVLVVSRGLPSVTVPTFGTSTSWPDAQKALQKLHFKPTRQDEWNADVAKGDVVSVTPTGSQRYGTAITVTVSKGPQPVTVPSFTRLSTTLSDYESQLSALGLKYQVDTAFGGVAGLVVSVSPGPGTTLYPGDTVTITII